MGRETAASCVVTVLEEPLPPEFVREEVMLSIALTTDVMVGQLLISACKVAWIPWT